MTTVNEITQAWQQVLANGIDPYLDKTTVLGALLDPVRESPGIEASLLHMRMLKSNHEKFFSKFDYAWVDDSRAYSFALESNLQARLLQQLCTYWDGCKTSDTDIQPLTDIVIRRTFTSKFTLATPTPTVL